MPRTNESGLPVTMGEYRNSLRILYAVGLVLGFALGLFAGYGIWA